MIKTIFIISAALIISCTHTNQKRKLASENLLSMIKNKSFTETCQSNGPEEGCPNLMFSDQGHNNYIVVDGSLSGGDILERYYATVSESPIEAGGPTYLINLYNTDYELIEENILWIIRTGKLRFNNRIFKEE